VSVIFFLYFKQNRSSCDRIQWQ